jgi:protein-L-isoaspartate(D-aspartate) O-methyltransferase
MWPKRRRDPDDQERLARLTMVSRQLERRGIHDERLLQAMREVPRHAFVPAAKRAQAYRDYPLPISEQQTISQPYIVALMIQCLRLQGGERVLEIGTGSGYQAAVLSRIAAQVYTVECFPSLAVNACLVIQRLGYRNVRVAQADGCRGFAEGAPYQGIIVAAASPFVPASLQAQLADGGRLVIPVGGMNEQRLTILTRRGDAFIEEKTVACRFVPLLGADAESSAGVPW